MALFLHLVNPMKKYLLPVLLLAAGAIALKSMSSVTAAPYIDPTTDPYAQQKVQEIVIFNPEVDPDIEELLFPSYQTFFDGVTQEFSKNRNVNINRIETPLEFDKVDEEFIKEICLHNNSDFAVVPKIKYFKVGIGRYVLSNQVVVSLKLYNRDGELLSESSYDTYRKSKRILGSTENSIKIGTSGALNALNKFIRKAK